MITVPLRTVSRVVQTLLNQEAKKVTAFVSPTLTVKASRILYDNKIDRRNKRAEIVLTLGVPNYAERKFIKLCQRAGERFPVRKLQVRATARG